ncbi:FKBP12-associated protein [Pseudogymnoascus destructans]|uniref:FKBP12-associated protein n=1 Tax=Pseudogymnoascus destructans TaxID=655981 RepID=A0A177AD93_9PEZI|nr:FKBP12-associated protein [Pseudogymnoascus destructans]OAF60075.1 FKBP12-associated protein [Pseudogymnoascus destructans]
MSTPGAPPAQGAGQGGRPRHYRRPRRGGAQNGTAPAPGAPRDSPAQPAQGNADTVPPAPVAPQAAPGLNPNPNRRNNGQSNRGRGGRPGQKGGAPRHVMGGVGGRAFGGKLTSAGGASGSSASLSLQADAPAFTPGQTVVPRTTATHNYPPPNIGRQRRLSKSQAADIATRTHEDILHGLYECPICTSEVLKNSKVWSCKTCWTVFHLSCVKKWAKNEGSTQKNRQQLQDGELPPARQWRCPGCNLPKDDMPESYTCWCAKDVDPKAIPGLPPHSCGQTCGKPRAPRNCPHPCDLICHAGPCPPCPHIGPVQACFCGKYEVSKRCIDTHYDSGWSCGKKCGDMMPCGKHECEKGCHEGLCGSCEVLVESRCYCGKVEKMMPCSDRGDDKDSSIVKESNEVDSWTGSFECGNVCKRAYDCGRHFCEKSCHKQTGDVPHCPLSPDAVTYCPCGKSTLKDLDCTRISCEEPIPHCQKLCLKQLACGHECQQKCHEGECLPCLKVVPIVCRCGRTTSSTICHQGTETLPQCMRICKTALNCGRHECGEHCCPGEKPAGERIAAKRKQKVSRGTTEDFEAEHICTRNSVTVAHAAPVEKPSLMRSLAIAVGLCFTRHYHAALSRLLVHTNAIGAPHVAIPQSTTNATAMESPAPSARTLCRRHACVARKSLKTNLAGPPRSPVDRLADIAFVVAFTRARSHAIGLAIVRMLSSPNVSMSAVRPRPHPVAATFASSPATRHIRAKKTSRAMQRLS